MNPSTVIGREEELATISRLYESDRSEFLAVYGPWMHFRNNDFKRFQHIVMRDFDKWIAAFRPSIADYKYYVDFDKVFPDAEFR